MKITGNVGLRGEIFIARMLMLHHLWPFMIAAADIILFLSRRRFPQREETTRDDEEEIDERRCLVLTAVAFIKNQLLQVSFASSFSIIKRAHIFLLLHPAGLFPPLFLKFRCALVFV